jgi:hypothetical protein
MAPQLICHLAGRIYHADRAKEKCNLQRKASDARRVEKRFELGGTEEEITGHFAIGMGLSTKEDVQPFRSLILCCSKLREY